MGFNNKLILQWYKDSKAAIIGADTSTLKEIILPISFTQEQFIGVGTFSYYSGGNWARSEMLYRGTTLSKSQISLFCHQYTATLAINCLFIGY